MPTPPRAELPERLKVSNGCFLYNEYGPCDHLARYVLEEAALRYNSHTALVRERDELLKDKARLEWVIKHGYLETVADFFGFPSSETRRAIDLGLITYPLDSAMAQPTK